MTVLENEFEYSKEAQLKRKREEEENIAQELDLRNSMIKIKRQKTSLDISISKEDITSIKGVGGRVAEKLKEAGFNSITGIANTTAEQLSKINGIGKATAEKIILGAKAVTERKNLQDFTPGKIIVSKEVKRVVEETPASEILDDNKAEEEVLIPEEIIEIESYLSPSPQKIEKVKVPKRETPIVQDSVEAETEEDFRFEEFGEEEE